MSYYPRGYEDGVYDLYYNQGGYPGQDAGGSSGSSSYDRGLPPARMRRPENLPTKPHSSSISNNAPRSAGSQRGQSPPRKIARTESSGGTSTGGAPNRRDSLHIDPRGLDKAMIRKVHPPDPAAAIQSLIGLMQEEQRVSQEAQELQVKNAALLRISKRDDVSEENKKRVDRANEEINNAKKKVTIAWKKIEDKLKLIIFDQIIQYIQEDHEAIREFVSSQWKAIGMGGADVERARTLQRQEMSSPREYLSARTSTVEPGEITELPAAQRNKALPETSTQTVGAMAEKGKSKQNPNALSTRIRERLETMENDVLENHERMDQIEAMVEELVRTEVADYVEKARLRREEKKEKKEKKEKSLAAAAAAAASAAHPNGVHVSAHPNVSSSTTLVPFGVGSASVPHNNGSSTMMPAVADASTNTTKSYARSKDDYMSREEVDALLESMRQSMRQEFDTKLFEQGRSYQRVLEEMSVNLTARDTNNHRAALSQLHRHYEVLENHGHSLNRHEQLLAGTMGTLSHIPKPQPPLRQQ